MRPELPGNSSSRSVANELVWLGSFRVTLGSSSRSWKKMDASGLGESDPEDVVPDIVRKESRIPEGFVLCCRDNCGCINECKSGGRASLERLKIYF